MFEKQALLAFIAARPEGNILREIAERYLKDRHKVPRKTRCFNAVTHERYESIAKAATAIGVKKKTLEADIYYKRYYYYIYPL